MLKKTEKIRRTVKNNKRSDKYKSTFFAVVFHDYKVKLPETF